MKKVCHHDSPARLPWARPQTLHITPKCQGGIHLWWHTERNLRDYLESPKVAFSNILTQQLSSDASKHVHKALCRPQGLHWAAGYRARQADLRKSEMPRSPSVTKEQPWPAALNRSQSVRTASDARKALSSGALGLWTTWVLHASQGLLVTICRRLCCFWIPWSIR